MPDKTLPLLLGSMNMRDDIVRIQPDDKNNRYYWQNKKRRMRCAFQAEGCWGCKGKYNSEKNRMADTNYWRFRPDNHHCTLELKEANLIIGQQVPAKVCAYCDDLNTAARACQRNMASVIQQVVSDEEMDEQGKEEEPELAARMQNFVKGTVDLDRYIQLEKELKNARSSVANWKKNARNARSEKATAQATVAALLIENTELREAVDDSRTFSLKEGPHNTSASQFPSMACTYLL
jgi:hypothetical protein